MGILFHSSGLLTTVQDAGRTGYQRYGMDTAGAADLHAYTCANILAGNPDGEAALEITLMGPAIEFTTPAVIAITGADLSPLLNGRPCARYQALRIQKGQLLTFGEARSGCRAYIAFAGGLALSPVMGSRSTYLKGQVGGYEGRRLMAGDEIAFRRPSACPANLHRRQMESAVYPGQYTLRVLMGPQEDRFTQEGIETFLREAYSVTGGSDRMGCRLTGPKIGHVTDGNVISDGIVPGVIQVPDSGQPIIMLSDHQTIGGYTKIASVIHADLSMAAQCRPGDTIRFAVTDIDAAQDAYLAQKADYTALRAFFDREEHLPAPEDPACPGESLYTVHMDGKLMQASVRRIY